MMSPLLDISSVPAHCCNHGLDEMHKAIAEEPSEVGIWARHDNPWLADICEQFTQRGQRLIAAAQGALLAALGMDAAAQPLRKADLAGH
jgi:hypothetical protein